MNRAVAGQADHAQFLVDGDTRKIAYFLAAKYVAG